MLDSVRSQIPLPVFTGLRAWSSRYLAAQFAPDCPGAEDGVGAHRGSPKVPVSKFRPVSLTPRSAASHQPEIHGRRLRSRYNCFDGRIVQGRISWTAGKATRDRSLCCAAGSVGLFWFCLGCRWLPSGRSPVVVAGMQMRLQRRSHFLAPRRGTTPAWRTVRGGASGTRYALSV